MGACDISSFTVAREKMVGNLRLEDDESTQSVSEGDGVERAPGYKAWGSRYTYAEAMQRREDEANRKKRIRDGSPDYFRDGHCQMEDRLSEHRPNRRCEHWGGIPNENDCDCDN